MEKEESNRKESNKKIKKHKNKKQSQYDRTQLCVKIIACILAILMIVSVSISLIYALVG